MTQKEVADRLHRLHFVGKWAINRLAKESGLSAWAIERATTGLMSDRTQTRLEMLFKALPEKAPVVVPKRKPGHKKRFLFRYLNLRKWIAIIEEHEGRNKNFKLKRGYDLSTNEKAGYICTKLDFMLKWYLLKVFGAELQKRKIFFGDCFAAEKWIERIKAKLPNYKGDLLKRLTERKMK